MKKLLIAASILAIGTASPALANQLTSGQWDNGWPQHANVTNSWCSDSVAERNKWAYQYAGYCLGAQ